MRCIFMLTKTRGRWVMDSYAHVATYYECMNQGFYIVAVFLIYVCDRFALV